MTNLLDDLAEVVLLVQRHDMFAQMGESTAANYASNEFTRRAGDLIRTHAAEIERNAMIAEAALKWWQEHQYDVASSDAGDGCIDECNVYDEPPEFVKIAMRGCGE